ncbi:hypothetical protein B566_EDAN009567 [Ephemera danica]|nr:hypothetical protein B566_EDAN009567 [Ephemera danica]
MSLIAKRIFNGWTEQPGVACPLVIFISLLGSTELSPPDMLLAGSHVNVADTVCSSGDAAALLERERGESWNLDGTISTDRRGNRSFDSKVNRRKQVQHSCSRAAVTQKRRRVAGIRGNSSDACEDHDPCQHGGICISTDSGPICECRNLDFEGAYCEKVSYSISKLEQLFKETALLSEQTTKMLFLFTQAFQKSFIAEDKVKRKLSRGIEQPGQQKCYAGCIQIFTFHLTVRCFNPFLLFVEHGSVAIGAASKQARSRGKVSDSSETLLPTLVGQQEVTYRVQSVAPISLLLPCQHCRSELTRRGYAAGSPPPPHARLPQQMHSAEI